MDIDLPCNISQALIATLEGARQSWLDKYLKVCFSGDRYVMVGS